MTDLFIKLAEVSVTTSIGIIALLLLRPFLKKCPSFIRCLLWCVILLRLLIPVHLNVSPLRLPLLSVKDAFVNESVSETPSDNAESVFTPPVTEDTEKEPQPQIPVFKPDVNFNPPVLENADPSEKEENNTVVPTPEGEDEKNKISPLTVVSIVWLSGIGIMLLYVLISSIVLYVKTRKAVVYDNNIRIINAKTSPFIKGIINPTVYIPAHLDKSSWKHIIAHENAHIKRHDHLLKPIAFIVLAVYWMNPFLWVAYIMLCRDIEYACDEKVVKNMEREEKQEYSVSLLSCTAVKSFTFANPLAFGKVSVKERIKRVMTYKKSVWATCLAVLLSAVLVFLMACSPVTDKPSSSVPDTDSAETSDVSENIGEKTTYFGSYTETTDEKGNKGYVFKTNKWYKFGGKMTKELFDTVTEELVSLWKQCDYITLELGETESFTLEKEDFLLGGYHQSYGVSLSTSFKAYNLRFYDVTYEFKHLKTAESSITFEKPSKFGEMSEWDDEYETRVIDPLLFIRLIYGVRTNLVYNSAITSGVYSDAACIAVSDTASIVYWGGVSLQGHWWLTASAAVSASVLNENYILPEEEAIFNDGGAQTVCISTGRAVNNFKYISIRYDENAKPMAEKVLYEREKLTLTTPFYVKTTVKEELSDRGVSYLNDEGKTVYAVLKEIEYEYEGVKQKTATLETFYTSEGVDDVPYDGITSYLAKSQQMIVSHYTDNEDFINLTYDKSGYKYKPFFIETEEELQSFIKKYGELLQLDKGWDEHKSFVEKTKNYTFYDSSIFLMYFRTGSTSFEYAIESAYCQNGTLYVQMSEYRPPIYEGMLGAWFIAVEVKNTVAENIKDVKVMFEYDPPLGAASVAYAGYNESDVIYKESLNSYMVEKGEALPTYLINTAEDLARFKSTFGDLFQFNSSYDEIQSVNDMLSPYTDACFTTSSLILVYVESNSGGCRFDIKTVSCEYNGIYVTVGETADSNPVTEDMAGWLLCLEMPDSVIANCIGIVANYYNPN